ncbi:hypothetical protein GCM10027020_10690 [Nocardioides salsibiostraticola]
MARILVVDDDDDIRELLSLSLGLGGHVVEDARDGYLALELLTSGAFDLVILDVNMPHLNGLEVVSRLRASSLSPQPMVLMLSALATAADAEAGLAAGADEYATKPFQIRQIGHYVDRMLAGRSSA